MPLFSGGVTITRKGGGERKKQTGEGRWQTRNPSSSRPKKKTKLVGEEKEERKRRRRRRRTRRRRKEEEEKVKYCTLTPSLTSTTSEFFTAFTMNATSWVRA